MALNPGDKLGPHEIQGSLGAGGMGEVYRAKDTRLDRTVAIKILHTHLSENPQLKQRFDREAKVISNLSHPNICSLYDVGHQDGIDYLVMEYLEGETLADRIGKGKLSIEDTIRFGIQIAEALDHAHREGVVHRDLKPGNIIITRSGVKLLDFGLAKIGEFGGSPNPGLTALPTEAGTETPLTQEGSILGTFQYMAPEQLEGGEAYARTDIFALGTVLYEMATGRKAFEGKSQASLIAAILEREPPPISSIEPLTPPALDQLVKVCMAKDPEERIQTAHDVKLQLQWIAEGSSAAGIPAPVAARRKRREKLWLTTAVVFGLIAAGLGALMFLNQPEPPQQMRTRVLPPPESVFNASGGRAGHVQISPDGTTLVFAAKVGDENQQLWLRYLDQLEARPIPDTEDASRPFWSPDSRYIGFFHQGKLKKVAAAGGPAVTLCDDASTGRGGSWSREGTIVYGTASSAPLFSVSAGGGEPVAISELDSVEATHRYPHFLPDGKHFIYMARGTDPDGGGRAFYTYVATPESSDRTLIGRFPSNVVYNNGHLFYVQDHTLMAHPFDPNSLKTTGDPFPVAERLQYDPAFSLGAFSVADDGMLAYQTGEAIIHSELRWYSREGEILGLAGSGEMYFGVHISPDGTRIAVTVFDYEQSNQDVWIVDVERGISSRLTLEAVDEISPRWSPDGEYVAFGKRVGSKFQIHVQKADGSGTDSLLVASPENTAPNSWSPDGRYILTECWDGDSGYVGLVTLDPTPEHRVFTAEGFNGEDPSFSPNGRWVAYASREADREDVYVTTFPEPTSRWLISKDGGDEPFWHPDGTELIYRSNDNVLVAVEVETETETFRVGKATPLFQIDPQPSPGSKWNITPDGERFLVNTDLSPSQSDPITVVTDWRLDTRKK